MEETDAEVFEITDFTTVSELEKFVGSLVDVFIEWKALPETQQCSTNLHFNDCQFSISLCTSTYSSFQNEAKVHDPSASLSVSGKEGIIGDLTDPINTAISAADAFGSFAKIDGANRAWWRTRDKLSFEDCIVQRFGVSRFVLVKREVVDGGSCHLSQTVLSAIRLALLDSDWDVAVFLMSAPVYCFGLELRHVCCDGVCISAGYVTEYRDILLSKAPEHVYCLAGLLSLFKQKLSLPTEENVCVSMRHVYQWSDYGVLLYSLGAQSSPRNVSTLTDLSLSQMKAAINEPLDFLPIRDPISRLELTAVWSEVCETLVLENTITILDPFSAPELTLRLVSEVFPETALHNLVCHVCNLDDGVDVSERVRGEEVPPAMEALVREMSAAVFSDCIGDYEVPSFLPDEIQLWIGRLLSWRLQYRLLWQFVGAATFLAGEIAQKDVLLETFWHMFVEKIDTLWSGFSRRSIDGVDSGPPDHSTCPFHQNLQMFNYCVNAMESEAYDNAAGSSDCSSNEEFFDAAESVPPVLHEGRAGVFGDVTLLETGEKMYVPRTQEIAPMTSDQLQRQTEELLSMGSDELGSYRRADYMASTYLQSDMAAFKAANPGATLGDFIRWYSPADWLEDENRGRGCLSERMCAEGNVWRRTWTETQPMPVFRQNQLFRPGSQGLESLNYIKSMPISQVLLQLRPFIAYSSVFRLLCELQPSELVLVESDLLNIVDGLDTFSHEMSHCKFMNVHSLVSFCEHKLFMYRSLALKLGGRQSNHSLLCSLIDGASISVEQSDESFRRSLIAVFSGERNGDFQKASMKEYLLQCTSGSSSANSSNLSQRLYCCTDFARIRISTAICQDPLYS